jgi:hypothetical protein
MTTLHDLTVATKAKRRHLKILTYKGTSRQVFITIRFYILEIQSVMLVFSTPLREILDL